MDKRKSGEELDGHSAKRRKSDNVDISAGETVETTKKVGFELLEILNKTTDKHGRLIATHFKTLPNKRQYPEYYATTKLPIALDTIQKKLQNGDFRNLTALESYFKRMIQNARDFNARGSDVFEDAERLRKALSNFMRERNPEYKRNPGYTAVPTPLPGSESVDEEEDDEEEPEPEEEVEVPAAKKKAGRPQKVVLRTSTTPALSEFQYAGISFEGLTFQKAQEKIVEDAIRQKEFEKDEFGAFEPFIVLPSRTDYKDYYNLIKNPVSLKSLQKKVKGAIGRNAATGISVFKSWAAFEDEASNIWKNAYIYNEDGSDIFVLAKELESFIKKSLEKAKAVVPEPVGTKIKLKMPEPAAAATPTAAPKILLKFPSKATAAPSPTPQPQFRPQLPSVPVESGTNGTAVAITPSANGVVRQNPFRGPTSSATPAPNLDQLERARSASNSVPSPTPSNSAPVKNEEVSRNSPALLPTSHNMTGSQNAPTPVPAVSMLPPSTPGTGNLLNQSGYAQSFSHQPHYPPPNPGFESKWRGPGKTAADAMITNLSLATHPGLNITRHFRMDLPPSQTMTQQSITINLPSTHYYLQIKPTLSSAIMERQHKLFVTSGNQRLHAMPNIPGHAVDQRHPLFEARLLPGVNRIEIELIAALPRGVTKLVNGQDAELEKITVFANLMRS